MAMQATVAIIIVALWCNVASVATANGLPHGLFIRGIDVSAEQPLHSVLLGAISTILEFFFKFLSSRFS
jgi:hypothetical protein